MECHTHLEIDQNLCGTAVECSSGFARVHLTLIPIMSADARGLVHGGFVFGMADFTAMCAVNDPNVVLGSAETKFLKPLHVGDSIEAMATVQSESGNKRIVSVEIVQGETKVFTGTFTCFVLEKHVFDQ